MPSPCLKDSIAFVPICRVATSLAAVLEIFYSYRCDRIVVTSESQRPLGVLHSIRLLPYMMGGVDSNLQLSLAQLDLSILAPLAIMPADLTLDQFWLKLQHIGNGIPHSEYALVDGEGKFLGLLDSWRLVAFLTGKSEEANAESEPLQEPQTKGEGATTNKLEEKPKIERSDLKFEISNVKLNRVLIQLLERLPLPLMLQTNTGKTVRQNQAWRGHFGELQDPHSIGLEAARLLESGHPPRSDDSASQKEPRSISAEQSSFKPASPDRSCYLGTNPDTCICVCPLQNGSERVWQFVKIGLGNLLSNWELLATTGAGAASVDTPAAGLFRLAKLEAREESEHCLLGEESPLSNELWLVVAQDVTEQQQVAKELAAKNADLVQLNRLKDEFLACISHELKTPLTAVLGLSSLLKDRVLGELNERQTRYARLIYQSGRHLMTVVNDILDLTRMETGQLDLTLSHVNIATVCDRAYQQTVNEHQAGEKDEEADVCLPQTHFTLEIEPGLENTIADELRLRQMLVNLLSNALKFTDSTGSFGLKVSRWEGWIAFTVWDTGIGIPEGKQHLIFQKFQQLENPLTRQYQGTGLGLVLTQRLAHLHGGDVSFISKEGKGSEFTLLLPPVPPNNFNASILDDSSVAAGAIAAERFNFQFEISNLKSAQLNNRLILIVEATSRYIEDLTEKLTSLGYRVVIARSGTEALTKARALQPLAILLNPILPLLSGWDVLTLLKASEQTRHIPTIVTATVAEKSHSSATRSDGFLSLPVQLDGLRQQLNRLMRLKPLPPEKKDRVTLTILYFSQGDRNAPVGESVDSNSPKHPHTSQVDLSKLLHRHQCRVLEADDLDQAELLARIWQPQVVLLERAIANPSVFFQQLDRYPTLAKLSLVTLDEATTQAASQMKHLSVFPCLEPPGSAKESSALLQAIQVAAGINWKPNILVVELSMLKAASGYGMAAPTPVEQPLLNSFNDFKVGTKKRSESLRALIQYLQTAGFNGNLAASWDEVLCQLQQGYVDLLLLDLGDSTPSSNVMKAFHALRSSGTLPPLLVLERRTPSGEDQLVSRDAIVSKDTIISKDAIISRDAINRVSTPPSAATARTTLKPSPTVTSTVQNIATKVLPASLSMEDLLTEIRQALA